MGGSAACAFRGRRGVRSDRDAAAKMSVDAPSEKRPWRFVEPSALPGFGPALGFTLAYLSFFLLVPLAALALRPWENGLGHVVSVLTNPRTIAALKLSFGAAFVAACINAVFGTIAAWVLVRYDFP